MPQVTVYIRDEDMPTWRAIEKKSEFMHNALIEAPKSLKTLAKAYVEAANRSVVEIPAEVAPTTKVPATQEPEMCPEHRTKLRATCPFIHMPRFTR